MTFNVRHGICQGGPKNGQTLATTSPGNVRHADDPNGFYVFKPASGTTPAIWKWISTARKETVSK